MIYQEKVIIPNDLFFDDVISMLSEGHTVTLRAKGNSMFPFIVSGRDCVVLQKATHVQAGDIVLARLSGERYVLHRIYYMDKNKVVLMGDGNVRGRERCQREDICGIVLKIIRGGRLISCSSAQAQRNFRLWRKLLPVRRYILAVWYLWRRWSGKMER